MRRNTDAERQYREKLGDLIRRARLRKRKKDPKRWSQEYLAGLLGVSRATVANIEKGVREPGTSLIAGLHEHLRIRLENFEKPPEKSPLIEVDLSPYLVADAVDEVAGEAIRGPDRRQQDRRVQ